MAIPSDPNARMYYRSAFQRLEESRFLLEGGMGAGAIYLAGYGVECILKSLILASSPASKREAVFLQLRGAKAHDFDWLQRRYRTLGGARFPDEIVRAFATVRTWTTDLRYRPEQVKLRVASTFVNCAERIVEFADERL
jgi:HEPN domain-containing protein